MAIPGSSGVPKYSNDPNTPFLQLMVENGYTSWYAFEKSDKLAFWKAIAAGLVLHTNWKYPDVWKFLETNWRPRINSVLTLHTQFSDFYHQEMSSRPDYWEQIGAAFQSLVSAHFLKEYKPEQLEIVESGRVISETNRTAYLSLAKEFRMCLTWYQVQASGKVVSHIFFTEEKGQVSLFVNIAQDADKYYLLYHKELYDQVKVGFPFFMKVGVKGGGEPLEIGSQLPSAQPIKDVKEALIEALSVLVEAQAALILSEVREYTPASESTLSTVKEKYRTAVMLISTAGVTGLPLNDDTRQRLEGLRVKPPEIIRAPHTIETCEQYPEDPYYINLHNHRIHRGCLYQFLDSLQPVTSHTLPPCPISGCFQSLPESILDLHPTLKNIFETLKDIRYKAASVPDPAKPHEPIPAASSTIPPDFNCVICKHTMEITAKVKHSCNVCSYCAYGSFCNKGYCSVCNQSFNEWDMSQFNRWYYTQQPSQT